MPRCIGGKDGDKAANLDPINTKLMFRRFSKARAGHFKSGRSFWMMAETPQEEMNEIPTKLMRKVIEGLGCG